jgi:hypothetical protein
VPVFGLSFPRRQQARRLRRAGASGAAAIFAGGLAATAANIGAAVLAGLLAVVATPGERVPQPPPLRL